MALLQSGTRIYGVANVDTQIYVGSNVSINTTGILVGNSTSTILPTMSVANSTANVTVTPISITVGTTNIVNTTGIYHTGTVNAASHTIGTTLVANTLGVYHTGTVNAASHTIGTTLVANTLGMYHTGTINAASHTIGTTFIANTTQITISTIPLSANGTTGSTGYVLVSNGAIGSPYWIAPTKTVRVSSTTSITSPLSWNSDTYDMYVATAQAASLTINADSGTPVNGQKIIFRFKDNGSPQTLSFTTGVSNGFRAVGVTIPTTTTATKTTYVGCIYNSADSRWDVIAVTTEI